MIIGKSPVFILGVPRSGTTLLRLLLNAHSEIAICGEIHFFDQVKEIEKKLPELNKENINTFFRYLNNTYSLQKLTRKEELFENVSKLMKSEQETSYEKFYLYLMQEYAKLDKKKIIGEKTPQNIRYVDEILKLFPDAKIIHIIRDPRAAIASMLKVDWTADDVIINTLKWKIDILFAESYDKTNSNYKEIHYEELIKNTEPVLKELCEFIGVEYEKTILDFHKTAKQYIGNQPEKVNTFKPLSADSLERWKNELSPEQIYIIEKIAGSYIEKLGYEKTKIKLKHKLLAPFVFIKELKKYSDYKKKDKVMREQETPEIIYAENDKLKSMLWKAILKR
jgi:hypothetical protein